MGPATGMVKQSALKWNNGKRLFQMRTHIALLVLFASFVIKAPAQETSLMYRLSPGTAYRTATTIHTSLVQKVMGIDQEILMDMMILLEARVEDFNNGIYTIEYRYKQLKIITKSAMFAVEIDTEGPPSPQNSMMKVLIGKPFTATMDERGRILDVTGLDQIIDGVDTLSGVDDSTKEQYRLSLEESFGKTSFVQNMEQGSVIYPEKPVKPGQTWNYNYTATSSNIDLHLHNVATLKEVNRNSILIRINSLIETPANDSIVISGSPGKISMTGQQLSEVWIDPTTGLITESNVSQDINGRLILTNFPDTEEPMEIPMTMTSKLQVTLTREK